MMIAQIRSQEKCSAIQLNSYRASIDMERWQKIERCLSEFFRNREFEVHQQGDVFAEQPGMHEFNLTALAKEIDSEIEK